MRFKRNNAGEVSYIRVRRFFYFILRILRRFLFDGFNFFSNVRNKFIYLDTEEVF